MGVLDAFIDYNRDGDWLDAQEKIFSQRALVAGPNVLTFSVPVVDLQVTVHEDRRAEPRDAR